MAAAAAALIEPSSPFWAVACVSTNKADIVQHILKQEGFTTYLPKVREQKRIAPLFPGYLIVRVIVRWYPIRWTPGVLRVLMDGDQPAHLADKIVDDIKRQEVRGFVRLPEDPKALKPGKKVRVLSGTFMGQVGIYQGQSGADRERILLEWLGRSCNVELSRKSIEVVCA